MTSTILLSDGLCPAGGGSWQIVETFISTWSDRRAHSDGSSLYARLYSSVHGGQGYDARETLMNWAKMKRSFEDITQRYPAAKFKNSYASHACVMQDKEAFRDAMAMLSTSEIDTSQWLQGHSYQACMRWAGV